MKSKVCAIIPARFQSSRLPGKPLLKINEKSVIQRTFEQTAKSKYLDQVFVVTDDQRIIDHVKTFSDNIISITKKCLNGTERICHALIDHHDIFKEYDIIVNVQGDEPFIDPEHIDKCIKQYLDNEEDQKMVCTTLHYQLNNKEDIEGRSIGKMVVDLDDNVMYCSRAVIPHTKDGKINDSFEYMGHIGIFVFRKNYLPRFLNHQNTQAQLMEDIEWLKIIEMGYRIKSYQVENSEIGVNTIEDYKYLKNKYR